jgi:SAM-dependent methyltransferase
MEIEAVLHHRCPVCQAQDSFIPFNGRQYARCSKCLCVERNRLMWLALDRLQLPRTSTRVLHFAPELGIATRLAAICGEGYVACDLSPDRYRSKHYTVQALDLCTGLDRFAGESFDLILHNHVLEHLPCNVADVLLELERILAPGGVHLFSVPIRGESTTEDISPTISPEERKQRFGQDDHMRLFGRTELPELLRSIWMQEEVLFDFGEDFNRGLLEEAAIPLQAVSEINGNSMFLRRKPRT